MLQNQCFVISKVMGRCEQMAQYMVITFQNISL